MLRNGHVRVTCGADQQPPAEKYMTIYGLIIFIQLMDEISSGLCDVA